MVDAQLRPLVGLIVSCGLWAACLTAFALFSHARSATRRRLLDSLPSGARTVLTRADLFLDFIFIAVPDDPGAFVARDRGSFAQLARPFEACRSISSSRSARRASFSFSP